jgi:hypothetical protein
VAASPYLENDFQLDRGAERKSCLELDTLVPAYATTGLKLSPSQFATCRAAIGGSKLKELLRSTRAFHQAPKSLFSLLRTVRNTGWSSGKMPSAIQNLRSGTVEAHLDLEGLPRLQRHDLLLDLLALGDKPV